MSKSIPGGPDNKNSRNSDRDWRLGVKMSRSTEQKEKKERKNMERMLLFEMQGSLSLDLVYAEYLVFFQYSQGLAGYLRAR